MLFIITKSHLWLSPLGNIPRAGDQLDNWCHYKESRCEQFLNRYRIKRSWNITLWEIACIKKEIKLGFRFCFFAWNPLTRSSSSSTKPALNKPLCVRRAIMRSSQRGTTEDDHRSTSTLDNFSFTHVFDQNNYGACVSIRMRNSLRKTSMCRHVDLTLDEQEATFSVSELNDIISTWASRIRPNITNIYH